MRAGQPDAERRAFDLLAARLAGTWTSLHPARFDHTEQVTSVVVPSFPRPRDGAGPSGTFEEERLLFLMIRLRNPRARLVYVTSQPVHPMVVEYYLQLLFGIPSSHARARLTLLSVHDASPRPLSEKILERPRLLARIRGVIPDRNRAFLTVLRSTPLERRLAVELDIPLWGANPDLAALAEPDAAVEVFREAGVRVSGDEPAGSPHRDCSVELRIEPDGSVHLVSTHEFPACDAAEPREDCVFPAPASCRGLLARDGRRVAEKLAAKGVVGPVSITFRVHDGEPAPGDGPRLAASDLRLGKGPTTHPLLALGFLTGGHFDEESGVFLTAAGHPRVYRSTEGPPDPTLRLLLPEDLLEIITSRGLRYDPCKETGVLFHSIGALAAKGVLGLTAIGENHEEADALHAEALATLRREALGGEPRREGPP